MTDFHDKFVIPGRYYSEERNIWSEYEGLATKYKPLNLANGFPDFLPPQYVKDAFIEVANGSNNNTYQYTRGVGHPRLISALSKTYSKLTGRDINPNTEIVVSAGGYHALFLSIVGIVDQGDQVIIIEPFFESFKRNVEIAGGVPRLTKLKLRKNVGVRTSDDWVLDHEHLESLFNEKTKAIIINTPHNPLGKIFSFEELNHIAGLCQKWNVVCICDEVYEFLVFDSKQHIRMATLPAMWDRTITLSSAGKIFGVTGFKIGWIYGSECLISNLQKIQLASVRAVNTFLQEVVAICFEKELTRLGSDQSYFISLAKEVEAKRDFMFKFLTEAGLKPILPAGGYFMVADWTPLEKFIDLSEEKDQYKDYRFTKWMTKNIGILGIPLAPFCSREESHMGEHFVRYCFVKTDDYLKKVAQVFKDWKRQLN